MFKWITKVDSRYCEINPRIAEESALAQAQAAVENAIKASGISQAELARRMGRSRSFVSRMMTGSHNMTIKTFARSLAACGFEPSFAFEPISWEWSDSNASEVRPPCQIVPLKAHAAEQQPDLVEVRSMAF